MRQRLLVIAGCAVLHRLLIWSFATVESTVFDHLGLVYNPPSAGYQLLGLVMAALPATWLPLRVGRASDVAYWLLYLMVVMPVTFLPFHVLVRGPEEIVVLPISILGMFALLSACRGLPQVRLAHFTVNPFGLHLALGLVTLFFAVLLAATNEFQFDLSLDTVYDRRQVNRENVEPSSAMAYIITSLGSAFGPLMFVFGLVRRNVAWLAVGLFGMAVAFSVTGEKMTLFSPAFLLGLYMMIRWARDYFALTLVGCTVVMVVLSVLMATRLGRIDLSQHFVRRMILIPGLLTCNYWDFFSHHELVYYAQSFARPFFQDPYQLPVARLIGAEYFHSVKINANGNVWASAYANVGYTGMFVITLLLGFLLRLTDAIGAKGDFVATALMAGMFAIVWSNCSLETSMLSNGVAVSCLVLFCMPKSAAVAPAATGRGAGPIYRPPPGRGVVRLPVSAGR